MHDKIISISEEKIDYFLKNQAKKRLRELEKIAKTKIRTFRKNYLSTLYPKHQVINKPLLLLRLLPLLPKGDIIHLKSPKKRK